MELRLTGEAPSNIIHLAVVRLDQTHDHWCISAWPLALELQRRTHPRDEKVLNRITDLNYFPT